MSQIHIKDMPDDSMIRIKNAVVYDLEESIAASKYPMQVVPNPNNAEITPTVIKLAQCKPGTGHDNYLGGIRVAFDICMTAKALIEAERYHFYDIVSCNSTMHRITKFDLNDIYCEYVDPRAIEIMKDLVEKYNADPTPENYLRVLYTNPSGFTYTMRITTNYRQLKTIRLQRDGHRIPEWKEFCNWIDHYLPQSEFIRKETN